MLTLPPFIDAPLKILLNLSDLRSYRAQIWLFEYFGLWFLSSLKISSIRLLRQAFKASFLDEAMGLGSLDCEHFLIVCGFSSLLYLIRYILYICLLVPLLLSHLQLNLRLFFMRESTTSLITFFSGSNGTGPNVRCVLLGKQVCRECSRCPAIIIPLCKLLLFG